jgi:hypothetical protein
MAIFTRRRPATKAIEADTHQASSADVIMRFATLGGAEVVVEPVSSRWSTHGWKCRGCDRDRSSSDLHYTRETANEHAGNCRSMPKPDKT